MKHMLLSQDWVPRKTIGLSSCARKTKHIFCDKPKWTCLKIGVPQICHCLEEKGFRGTHGNPYIVTNPHGSHRFFPG